MLNKYPFPLYLNQTFPPFYISLRTHPSTWNSLILASFYEWNIYYTRFLRALYRILAHHHILRFITVSPAIIINRISFSPFRLCQVTLLAVYLEHQSRTSRLAAHIFIQLIWRCFLKIKTSQYHAQDSLDFL